MPRWPRGFRYRGAGECGGSDLWRRVCAAMAMAIGAPLPAATRKEARSRAGCAASRGVGPGRGCVCASPPHHTIHARPGIHRSPVHPDPISVPVGVAEGVAVGTRRGGRAACAVRRSAPRAPPRSASDADGWRRPARCALQRAGRGADRRAQRRPRLRAGRGVDRGAGTEPPRSWSAGGRAARTADTERRGTRSRAQGAHIYVYS